MYDHPRAHYPRPARRAHRGSRRVRENPKQDLPLEVSVGALEGLLVFLGCRVRAVAAGFHQVARQDLEGCLMTGGPVGRTTRPTCGSCATPATRGRRRARQASAAVERLRLAAPRRRDAALPEAVHRGRAQERQDASRRRARLRRRAYGTSAPRSTCGVAYPCHPGLPSVASQGPRRGRRFRRPRMT